MDGFLLETTTLSALLNPRDARHQDATRLVASIPEGTPKYVSAVALAELAFGVDLIRAVTGAVPEHLSQVIRDASSHPILDITRHTAMAYGELKTLLAIHYLERANRSNRPRWLEDWIDRNTGKALQVDDNDLWMCAQAKERSLVLVTADNGISRIADVDPSVQLLLV